MEYHLTKKDLIAIKTASDYNQKNNVEYSKIVLEKIGLLIELMNSLFAQKVSIPDWKIWSETLIYKLCFHSASLIKLFEGTELPYKDEDKLFKILDESSIYSLLRVITENYLTFSYLYSDNSEEVEKKFRLSVWRYCGIKQRVEFEMSTETAKKKQEDEKILLASLMKEIESSSFFQNLKHEKRKLILKGRNPRLFNSWINLVNHSNLRVGLFKNLYGYNSNHSHSEFISVLQLKSSNYRFNPNEKVHFSLFLLHIIICKTIMDIRNVFPSVGVLFESKDFEIKSEIEILYNIGVDTSLDKNEQNNIGD